MYVYAGVSLRRDCRNPQNNRRQGVVCADGRLRKRATKNPQSQAWRGSLVKRCEALKDVWSPRQESNLYLALRRRLFYPLNYGESLRFRRVAHGANRTAVWTARRV